MAGQADPGGAGIGADDLEEMVRRCVGQPAHRLAVGVVGRGWEARTCVEADASTRFELGSVTKVLTGLLLADASHRGEIDLGRPIDAVLDRLVGTAAGTLTVGELAAHTSGLPRLPRAWTMARRSMGYAFLGRDPYDGVTVDDVVNLAGTARLDRRDQFRYSNFGAALAGAVVQEATGSTYADLLASRLTGPLWMSGSSVQSRGPEVQPGRSSRGRRARPWVQQGFAPAGGVVSTLDDMLLLVAALLDGVAIGSGPMLRRPAPAGRRFFAKVDGTTGDTRRVWHNGQTGGYAAVISLWPELSVGMVALRSVASAVALEGIMLAVERHLCAGAPQLDRPVGE